MKNNTTARWFAAFVILAIIPAAWWLSIAPWDAEIGGVYSFMRAVMNIVVTLAGLAGVYILLGRRAAKEKIQSVILAAVTAAVCVLLLETPALFFGFNYQNVFGTSGDGTALHLSGGVNKPDPVLLHIHWPYSAFSGEVAGNLVSMGIPSGERYQVDVRYDHNGFRNDRDYEQADIAVIGDSFVEAAIIPADESVVGQLAARLNRETVNLGQIAYGFRQELEVLRRFALPLSPGLVVWVLFGGNDLRDVESYEYQLSIYGEPAAPVALKQRLFLRNALVAGTDFFTGLARELLDMPSEKALNRSGLYTRSDNITERVYFGQTADPWTPHQWEVAVDTLQAAQRMSTTGGAEFVVVYIPRKFRIYRDYLVLAEDADIADWEINNLPEELGKWCVDNGIAFIDTSPHLEALVADGLHPYLIDDVHWNKLGHYTASRVIAEYLAAENMFPFSGEAED